MGQWSSIPESQYTDDSLHKREVDQYGGWYEISESQYYGASNQRRTQTSTRTVVDQEAYDKDVTHKNISFNGWNPSYISFNGNDIDTVYFNDVKVFWHESVHHDAVTHEEPVYKYEQYRETTYKYYRWVPSSPSITITSASADGSTISVSGRCSVDEKLTVRYINLVWGTHSASIAASNGSWSGTLGVGSDTGTNRISATIYDSEGQTATDSELVTVEPQSPPEIISIDVLMSGIDCDIYVDYYASKSDAEKAKNLKGKTGSIGISQTNIFNGNGWSTGERTYKTSKAVGIVNSLSSGSLVGTIGTVEVELFVSGYRKRDGKTHISNRTLSATLSLNRDGFIELTIPNHSFDRDYWKSKPDFDMSWGFDSFHLNEYLYIT